MYSRYVCDGRRRRKKKARSKLYSCCSSRRRSHSLICNLITLWEGSREREFANSSICITILHTNARGMLPFFNDFSVLLKIVLVFYQSYGATLPFDSWTVKNSLIYHLQVSGKQFLRNTVCTVWSTRTVHAVGFVLSLLLVFYVHRGVKCLTFISFLRKSSPCMHVRACLDFLTKPSDIMHLTKSGWQKLQK